MTEQTEIKKLSPSEILKILKQDKTNSESFKSVWDTKREQYHNEWAGKKYGNEKKNKSQVVSRDIKIAQIWQHSSIKDPFLNSAEGVKATPVGAEDTAISIQTKEVLNYQYSRQFNRYRFITSSLKVFQVEGTVIARVFWNFEEKEIEVEEPVMGISLIMGPEGPIPQQTQVGVKKVKKTVTTKNYPDARVCKNVDIWVDPTEKENIEDAKFVIERWKSNLSDLRQNSVYKNIDKIKVDSDSLGGESYDALYEDTGSFIFTDDARKEIDVYEYWGKFDIHGTGIAIPMVCAWVGSTIIRLEESPYSDGKVPFISCAFDPEPFSINGEANAEILSTDQKLRTAIKRSFIDTLNKSTNGQRGFQAGTLDPINASKFANGQDFEFQGAHPAFWEGKYNEFNSSVMNFYQELGTEIQNKTAARAFSSGQSSGALESAKQSGISMDAVGKMEVDISRNFAETFIKPMLIKWNAMNNDFLEPQDIERITGKPYVPVDPLDPTGSLDIRIQVNTAEADAQKSKELAFLQQTQGPNDDPRISQKIRAEMFRLKDMPELAKWMEEYVPQPDPAAQQIQMLQIKELEASIREKESRAQENMVDMELKKAKIIVEQAKARQMHADTDQTDLDYVDQQTGVTHQREMEKQQQKDNNNLRNTVFKQGSKNRTENNMV